jgi:hypothetical protein
MSKRRNNKDNSNTSSDATEDEEIEISNNINISDMKDMFSQLLTQVQTTNTQNILQLLSHLGTTHTRTSHTHGDGADGDDRQGDDNNSMYGDERRALSEAMRMVKATFGGEPREKVSTLLSQVDKMRKLFRWTDRVAIQVVGMSMGGKASDWFLSSVEENHDAMSWSVFHKMCLSRWTKRISPHMVPHHLGKFDPSIKQGLHEKCDDYLARIVDELQQVNSTEPHWLILCFLSGLRGDIMERVRVEIGMEAPTIDELLGTAIRIEIALGEKRGTHHHTPHPYQNLTHKQDGVTHGAHQSQYNAGKGRDVCSRCKQRFVGEWKDHARVCGASNPPKPLYSHTPSAPPPVNTYNKYAGSGSSVGKGPTTLTCHNCNQPGHIRRDCPHPNKPMARSVQEQPKVSPTLPSTPLPLPQTNTPPLSIDSADPNWLFHPITGLYMRMTNTVTVVGRPKEKTGMLSVRGWIGGKEERDITVDTGADVTLIHEDVFKTLPKELTKNFKPTNSNISGAGGEKIVLTCEGFLPFHFHNKEGRRFGVGVHVYVSPSLDVCCLLGHNFITEHTDNLYYGKKKPNIIHFIKYGVVELEVHEDRNVRKIKLCQPTHTSVVAPTHTPTPIHIHIATSSPHTPAYSLKDVEEEREKAGIKEEGVKGSEVARIWEGREKAESEEVRAEVCASIQDHVDRENLHESLGVEVRGVLFSMLCEHYHLFDNRKVGTARTPDGNIAQHYIYTDPERQPVKQRAYHHPKSVSEAIGVQVEEWLGDGTIVPSSSAWSSPVVAAGKKPDPVTGKLDPRVCTDSRLLNEQTIKDAFPLPNIDVMIRNFGKSLFFTTMDLKSAYHQIYIAPAHRHKTAFAHNNRLYEFVRMPFGLCNAPASFQRFIMCALLGLDNVMPYLDDIIIYSVTQEDHMGHVRAVLARLSLCGVKLKLSKCLFGQSHVKFLGHVIGPEGVGMDPEKVEAVVSIAPPTTVKKLQIFLGLCNYYSKFVEDYAKIAKPLHKLLGKDIEFVWGDECQRAFEMLKQKLSTGPILVMPDFSKPFALHTDASMDRVGGVLTQWVESAGREGVVMYVSRACKPAERNYSTTHQELLAIIFALKKFRPYIYGQKFKIYTDHQPLVHIRKVSADELTGRLGRWILYLEQYTASGNMEIIYKPGKMNSDADAMSRLEFTQVVRSMTRSERQRVIGDEMEERNELGRGVTTNVVIPPG